MSVSARRSVAIPLVLACAGAIASTAAGAPKGWPTVTGLYYINQDDANSAISGTKDNDRLLGGHGNDKMSGEAGSDVLWGDSKPKGQSVKQFDRLSGGTGRDFIYASHGYNVITGGDGNDRINAHWGRGRIDCGAGADILYISRKRRARYEIHSCEQILYTRYAPGPVPTDG